ncbi:Cytochrome P450 monooxygenase aneF-like protein [Cladobotryum mycophilum]|uniref:Cytochrome P450 monooxygenase aneF-like protein n=1 Tax=Cladobotryum mycophilum TaxID=491253 RepID=A0ABR0T2L9_9HYPO
MNAVQSVRRACMMILTPSTLYAVAGVAIALAVVYKLIVYRIFLSPLSKLPSVHPLANVTDLWIQWHRWRGTYLDVLADAFARKGPYIRLGPDEFAANTKEAVLSIYGVGANNLDKHKTYANYRTHGASRSFIALGKEHAYYRRRIAGVYLLSFLQTSPHAQTVLKTVLVERLLPIINHVASNGQGTMDIVPILQSFGLDYASAFVFGLSRGTRFMEDEGARNEWLERYNVWFDPDALYWRLEHPLLTKFLRAIGAPIVPRGWDKASREFEEWSTAKVKASEAAIRKSEEAGVPLPDGELPIIVDAIRASMAQEAGIDRGFIPSLNQENELAGECLDQIIATRDVFGSTFAYIVYELSRHSDIQDELRRELLSLETPFYYHKGMTLADAIPSPTALQQLPLLNGVIKEGLRLRNTIPGIDPRVTPPNRKTTIGPLKDLPPGIRVGACGRMLHTQEELYPDPLSWDPRRWMSGGCNESGWFMSFGGGSRGCVGQQVTWELLRFALTGIYSNYKTTVADETEYPGAEGFVGILCDVRLFVKFESLRD